MAKLNITQVKSRIGSTKIQKQNLDALGLRKINQTVTHDDSKIIMGMLDKVKHLVRIEEATEKKTAKPAAKATEAPKAAAAAAPKAEKAAPKATKSAAKPAAKTAAKPAAKATEAPKVKKSVKPATNAKDESK